MSQAKKLISLAIMKSEDDGANWVPVMPEDVPEELKTDKCISTMSKGRYCGLDELVIGSTEKKRVWYTGLEMNLNAH